MRKHPQLSCPERDTVGAGSGHCRDDLCQDPCTWIKILEKQNRGKVDHIQAKEVHVSPSGGWWRRSMAISPQFVFGLRELIGGDGMERIRASLHVGCSKDCYLYKLRSSKLTRSRRILIWLLVRISWTGCAMGTCYPCGGLSLTVMRHVSPDKALLPFQV